MSENSDKLDPSREFPYPSLSADEHHEVELMVGLKSGGTNIPLKRALDHVWGYGVSLYMTRRDLERQAEKMGYPWEIGKAFERAAPVGPLVSTNDARHPNHGRISLRFNGEVREDGDLDHVIWKVPETILYLSEYFKLQASDVI